MKRHSTFPALFAGLCLASAANAADLTIEWTGLRSQAGEVRIAIWDSAETFQKDAQVFAAIRVRARAGAQRVTLTGLPEGSYAIAAFHDENQNGKLDTNLIGIPTEATAFSNNAAANFGPPKFEAAKLVLGATPSHTRLAFAN